MRMIRPKLEAPQLTIAEEQEEFLPVTAAAVRHPQYPGIRTRVVDEKRGPLDPATKVVELNSLVLAFRPTDDERARIAAGEDLYVSLLTFMKPMQGIIIAVGPQHFAEWYGVEVEK